MSSFQLFTVLDYVFIFFHSSLTLFNLAGWAWDKTRSIHLFSISLTVFSWFGLGVFYGWGYCPCTDWHWQVKHRLGESNLPYSYVKYYVDRLTGISWDPIVVDATVVILGLLAFGLSCWFNWRDHRNHINS